MRVGLLATATNRYTRFVAPFVASAREHFLLHHKVDTLIFTDRPEMMPDGVRGLYVNHAPWPVPTLARYHYVSTYADILSKYECLFYSDVDMLFVSQIGVEVLGDLVATVHPGFWNKKRQDFSYETRPESRAYVAPNEGTQYFAGGFQGGSRWLAAADEIAARISEDDSRGIVATWHDESHWNRYLIDHPPTVKLTPSYCYPESWSLPFERKLLALDKNHSELRT